MYLHEWLFLKRKFESDASALVQHLQSLGNTGTPVWLVLYPGTERCRVHVRCLLVLTRSFYHERGNVRYSETARLSARESRIRPAARPASLPVRGYPSNQGPFFDSGQGQCFSEADQSGVRR